MTCRERVWVTKEGREIPYSKLSDSHLLNIIRMMDRNVHYCLYGNPRGEMAVYYADLYVEQADFTLDGLEAEAAKRGLRP